MKHACSALLAVVLCGCDEVLVIVDGGVDVDAGRVVDGGVDVDAGVVDAGVVDAGVEECVITEVEEFPFVPNGTEDLIDPRGDAPYPDVDVLAMWSRMEGDTWVLEIQFAAPPFRREMGSELVIGLDRRPELDFGDEGLFLCLTPPCIENAAFERLPASGLVGLQAYPDPWPPDLIGSRMRDFERIDVSPPCDYVFATPREPFVQLRFTPALAPTVDWPTPYHWISRNTIFIDGDSFSIADHSWESTGDPFFLSRGGAAPATEEFVSVCHLTCDDISRREQ